MTIAEIRQQLLTEDDFVVTELQKVQVLYELKKVIRYDHTRTEEAHTESDAEHIFGMHCLIDYFLPLEDKAGEWDREQIRLMVQYHELDEIITGDKVSYTKTEADKAYEAAQVEPAIKLLPELMQAGVRSVMQEYQAQQTPEARFVKAIDKIEPVFHLYNQTGKETLQRLNTKAEEHNRIKRPYVEPFPVIKRFAEVMNEWFITEGYYCE